MKVLTILGTRPEIIRLCRVIERLDSVCDHVLVHTGQNYDRRLNEVFFSELGVRRPDHLLQARGSFAEQIGIILAGMERILRDERPDRFLVLGDTNSSTAAIVAKRLGVPVFHMEAGNRCYDERVPEEVNRRIIDHSSDVLLPYTERSRLNLLREGIPTERILVTGNPIYEVIRHHEGGIDASPILEQLGVASGEYLLVTMHREENVDVHGRLQSLTEGLSRVGKSAGAPVIVSTHPRTRLRMKEFGVGEAAGDVRFLEPFGFFDFIHLEQHARCVLSDSGTVQEECAILEVPCVTLRDTTERPETLECGGNVLSGVDPDAIERAMNQVLSARGPWRAPAEYLVENVSETVVNIVTGHLHRPRA